MTFIEGIEGTTQDDFGYGDNEDIYDIADEDMTGMCSNV